MIACPFVLNDYIVARMSGGGQGLIPGDIYQVTALHGDGSITIVCHSAYNAGMVYKNCDPALFSYPQKFRLNDRVKVVKRDERECKWDCVGDMDSYLNDGISYRIKHVEIDSRNWWYTYEINIEDAWTFSEGCLQIVSCSIEQEERQHVYTKEAMF